MPKIPRVGVWFAALALGCVACGVLSPGPPRNSGVLPSTAGTRTESLKLATWNIEWLTLRDPRGARGPADFRELRRYAAELDPDIVALQEVDGAEAAQLVFDPRVYDFHFTAESGNVQRTGFAWKKGLDVRPNPDFDSLALARRRPGADVTLHWGGRPLRLLALHLKSGCPEKPLRSNDDDCRILRAQLPALEAWVDARAGEGATFAVLGDFNRAFEGSDEFWRELDDGDPPGADLTDVGAGAHPACWGGRHARYIDHIVLSPALVPWAAAHSFHELVFAPAAGEKLRLSDHCPLALTLIPHGAPGVASGAAARPGQFATVCGRVASARFLEPGNGMTFLDLDAPHPDQRFTIVIRAADRGAFDRPEVRLLHQRICVTGTVESYRGKPQIAARTSEQIDVDSGE